MAFVGGSSSSNLGDLGSFRLVRGGARTAPQAGIARRPVAPGVALVAAPKHRATPVIRDRATTPMVPQMRRAFRSLSNAERVNVAREALVSDAPPAAVEQMAMLGDDDLAGLSLGKILGNATKAVTKAVKDTGHAVGSAVTSKVGQAVIGAGLAATGVGIPAAVAIGASTKAAGELIKPGGNLGKAAHGAVTGAATGAVAGVAGKVIAAKAPMVTNSARSIANKLLPGNPLKPLTAGVKGAGKLAGSTVAKTAGAGGAVIATGIEVLKPQITPEGTPTIEGPKVAELPKAKRQKIAPPDRPTPIAPEKPLTKKRVAETTIEAGRRAKKAADEGAGKLDAVNDRITQLESALGKAKDAGDAAGFDKISAALEAAQQKLAQASSVVSTGSSALSTAGTAAEGAATGAVAGGAASGFAQWVQENKGLAIGGTIGVATLIAIVMSSGHSSRRSSYRRRAA